jgi:flagellar hook-length control protein FliK
MNSNLLTINNMLFAGTAVSAVPATKPNIAEKGVPFSTAENDTFSPSNIIENTTTDNKTSIAHNNAANKPNKDFLETLRSKAATKKPPQDKDKINSEKPNSIPHKTAKPDIMQNHLAQISQTLNNNKEGNPTIVIKSHTTRELTQSLNNSKADKSSPETPKITESAKSKPSTTTIEAQPAQKTISQDTTNSQSEPQTVLSKTSKVIPAGDAQPKEGKNTGNEKQISNNKIPQIKTSNNSTNSNESAPNTPVANGIKTTVVKGKTTPADTPIIVNSQEIATLKNSKSAKENPISDYGKKTNINEETTPTDKSVISASQKTIVSTSSTDSSSVQGKSTKFESQNAAVASEKSTSSAEPPVNIKVATPQTLSESTQNNHKELLQSENKTSKTPTTQKDLNITELKVSTTQTKNLDNTTSNNSPNSGSKGIISDNNPQTPITEQSPPPIESTKTNEIPAQSAPKNALTDVNKQIFESIQNSLSQQKQDQHITVHLNPPELGKVLIKFREQDEQITGLLEVEKSQTRVEIQQSLPEIIRSLQDSGIQIKRLDVALSEREQLGQEALKDQFLPNGGAQSQNPQNPHSGANNPGSSGINEWLTNNNSYYNISELQETLATDGSINMLA